jgi:hypothetical protein
MVAHHPMPGVLRDTRRRIGLARRLIQSRA